MLKATWILRQRSWWQAASTAAHPPAIKQPRKATSWRSWMPTCLRSRPMSSRRWRRCSARGHDCPIRSREDAGSDDLAQPNSYWVAAERATIPLPRTLLVADRPDPRGDGRGLGHPMNFGSTARPPTAASMFFPSSRLTAHGRCRIRCGPSNRKRVRNCVRRILARSAQPTSADVATYCIPR